MPYLYGYALNSFSKINVRKDHTADAHDYIVPLAGSTENLNDDLDSHNIPIQSEGRKKYFTNADNASEFTFLEGQVYTFQFDTDLIKLGNSQYKILIPTYGNRTLDIDVAQYANENLNNFNWVLKKDGINGAKEGTIGLLINFALTPDDSNSQWVLDTFENQYSIHKTSNNHRLQLINGMTIFSISLINEIIFNEVEAHEATRNLKSQRPTPVEISRRFGVAEAYPQLSSQML